MPHRVRVPHYADEVAPISPPHGKQLEKVEYRRLEAGGGGGGAARLVPHPVARDEIYVGGGGNLDWKRLEVSGWGHAHHSYEIPAAVLAHQLFFAAAPLNDTTQPPVEHDVGAV